MKQFLIKYRFRNDCHLATAADDDAVQKLQSREFFTRSTGQTERAADGDVDVVPLEIIAETAPGCAIRSFPLESLVRVRPGGSGRTYENRRPYGDHARGLRP